ncbi:MAG: methyltransferase domain-containing protein [Clostridiaceae bacterium]|nr:methyltransferase domain-containing protein [Clostridiaceae bacterium]
MYNTLIKLLEKPKIYEKTQEKFWDDLHISKGMLETHLNPNTDAASRRPDTIERSVNWICSLLPHGARLLDIGCGPGLYTKRLSERGLCVTGLDFSERSIAYAKEHDAKSEYVMQNYLKMNFENLYDMVTLIWCDYGALIPEDRYKLLDRVYRALKPGGIFLLDVFTPQWKSDRNEHTSWEVYGHGGFWSPNPHICLNAQYYYGERIDMERFVIVEDGSIRSFNIWNTCFTRQSISEEMQMYNFFPVDYYSDVEGKPYDKNSSILCVVMKKHEAR